MIMAAAFFLVLLFLAFLIILSRIYQHKKHYPKNHLLRSPPGPTGLPIIGNLHQLDFSALHTYFWRLSKQYGPLMSMRLGSVPILVVSSAKMAKEIYKTHDITFASRPSMSGLQKLSYNGVDVANSPYNNYWRDARKTCSLHLFNSKRIQSFRLIREEEVWGMVKRISALAHSSRTANLSEIVTTLSCSILSRVAFGKRYDDNDGGRRIDRILIETQVMFVSFFFSDYFPFFGWLDKLTGMSTRLDRVFKSLDVIYEQLIDEHLDADRSSDSRPEDILHILLQQRDNPSNTFPFTLDNIKAILMNIIVAGIDPSAATVVWAMTSLMKNPVAMKKAQDEVRKCVGQKGKVNEDDLQKLPYLKAVLKETMRLYPPAPVPLPRETINNCVIDGYEIQQKTRVYVNIWAIGRDPDCWENPDEFLPERFMGNGNDSIDFRGQNYELVPFGSGRRICPGIGLGVAMVELTLSNLLHSFDWELPHGMKGDNIDIDPLPGLTTRKKNELCLIPKVPDFTALRS